MNLASIAVLGIVAGLLILSIVANKGAATPPNSASRLSSAEAATFSLISKVCKNQITREATKIIVKAFLANPFAFSTISCHTLFAEGNR